MTLNSLEFTEIHWNSLKLKKHPTDGFSENQKIRKTEKHPTDGFSEKLKLMTGLTDWLVTGDWRLYTGPTGLSLQSISQSVNQSSGQPVIQSISHSVNQSFSQPVIQSISQSVNQSVFSQSLAFGQSLASLWPFFGLRPCFFLFSGNHWNSVFFRKIHFWMFFRKLLINDVFRKHQNMGFLDPFYDPVFGPI